MAAPAILCVDDQPEVVAAVERDLAPLAPQLVVVSAGSADEAESLADELDSAGHPLAVVVTDQVMPGGDGVSLLIRLKADRRFATSHTCLLTGQATHADTIQAINLAQVEAYIEKPWQAEQLLGTVRSLFTRWLLESSLDHLPFMAQCDQELLFAHLRRHS